MSGQLRLAECMKKSIISKPDIDLFQILKFGNIYWNLKVPLLFLFLCLSSLITIQCKKSSPREQLPPITQEGKNTFGCKVNGQPWVPYWPCIDIIAGAAEMSYAIVPKNNSASLPIIFTLNLGNQEMDEALFSFQQGPTLYSHLLYSTGNVIDSLAITYSTSSSNIYYNYYYPSKSVPRYFNIDKLDTVNRIISGTFAFTLYGAYGNGIADSVLITEGRFDLQIGYFSHCSN